MNWSLKLAAQVGNLSLDVELHGAGGPVALIGPNGSGKSTLLKLIAGAPLPATGVIKTRSGVVFDSSNGVFASPDARRVGYLPQNLALFPHLTALSNVAFGLRFDAACSSAERRAAALAQMRAFDCEELAESYPAELSGGEQQRVALARALVKESDLLLLDEPLSALDLVARKELRGRLSKRLEEAGTPALLVTHDPRDIEALGATTYVLSQGRVLQRGTPDELRASPGSDFVEEFFSDGRGPPASA